MAEYDEFAASAMASFSPSMSSHLDMSSLHRLDREIVWHLNNGANEDQITSLVFKICDVVNVHAKLPEAMTSRQKFEVHPSFMKMIETQPKKRQDYMKATLLSLASWDVIISQQLYQALGIYETKKNPLGTNLMKRAKLSVREAVAVLSRSHLGDFFKPLLETSDQEFASARAKIGASSYAKAVHFPELCEHFEPGLDR